ncbi:twin-arginine translocase TatA/TatE family subunit [bacterium]|nr:twin-arginine translocase TatA/TatE family subunit [bacterium]
MFGLGPAEIVVIGVVALLVFGPKRLPELARGMGKGIRDFKRALEGGSEEETSALRPPTETPKNTVARAQSTPTTETP